MGFIYSPFIVPVAAITCWAIMVIARMIGSVQKHRIQSEERMTMLQRGMSAEQIATVLKPSDKDDTEAAKTKDPLRSLSNARRTGIVLVSIGVGIVLFGLLPCNWRGRGPVLTCLGWRLSRRGLRLRP